MTPGAPVPLPVALQATAMRFCEAAAACDWRGPDAYDGLWHQWPRWVTGGRRRRQAVAQIHVRSPLDVRRLYRRQHPQISKGVALFAHAAVRLHGLRADPGTRVLATMALDVLDRDRSAGPDGWGYPFDMQTRWSFYPGNTANIIATSFAAAALHEGAQVLGEQRYRSRAERAVAWAVEHLFVAPRGLFVYYPGGTTLIHNANLLGARLAWTVLQDRESAAHAIEHALTAQRPDGSFPYGEVVDFVDSFHTGYVLECLAALRDLDPRIDEALERGSSYYVDRFFGPSGETFLWPDRSFPLDAHAAGTGMTTLAILTGLGYVDQEILARVADWSLNRMVTGDHAIFRRYRLGTTRVQYLRWADGHMALGFASSAAALGAPG